MGYGVISTCRNEEKNIKSMVDSVFNQTIKPIMFILINDDSTDNTHKIINEISDYGFDFKPFTYSFPRLEYAGFNMTVALNVAYEYVLHAKNLEYILKIDGDVVLEDKRYIEKILSKMNTDNKIHIGGGCSDVLISSPDHVQDGAKIYRKACLEIIKEYHGSAFPMIYGFDTYMQLFIQHLGFKVYSDPNILWIDKRPFNFTYKRAIMSGKFHYINSYPFLHELKVLFMTVRHNKYNKMKSVIRFLTYLVYHFKMRSPLLREHREFVYRRFQDNFLEWLRYRIFLVKLKILFFVVRIFKKR